MKHTMRPLLFLLLSSVTMADVVVYEGNVFPEEIGWERTIDGDPERWLEDGWLYIFCDKPEGWQGPTGDGDFYRKPLDEFTDEQAFFVEWRAQTDCPGSILEVSGTAACLSAYGSTSALYHTTFTEDRVRLVREGASMPVLYIDIAPSVPHTFRVEAVALEEFAWYIDGEVVHSGVPLLPYPTADSKIIWSSRHYLFDTLTRYDYVRYGTIPADGSGDFESDGQVDSFDFYYFEECFIGPGVDAGPGCRFADFEGDRDGGGDGDVDLRDFAAFQNAFTGPP